MFFQLLEKPLFAFTRAVVAFGIPQQHHLALAPHHFGKARAPELTTLDVVGRDKADVIVSLQPRVEDDNRDLATHRFGDRRDERRFVERRQHDPRNPRAADEALDLGHLRIAVVLAERPAPDDRDAELVGRLFGAGMDALPEDVRGALWNDGDRRAAARRCALTTAGGAAEKRAENDDAEALHDRATDAHTASP